MTIIEFHRFSESYELPSLAQLKCFFIDLNGQFKSEDHPCKITDNFLANNQNILKQLGLSALPRAKNSEDTSNQSPIVVTLDSGKKFIHFLSSLRPEDTQKRDISFGLERIASDFFTLEDNPDYTFVSRQEIITSASQIVAEYQRIGLADSVLAMKNTYLTQNGSHLPSFGKILPFLKKN